MGVKQEALDYHSSGRPGKTEVIPCKPYSSQRDLSLAYSPGVAEPCLEIEKDIDNVYKYTTKGNLVAVISNGTAVLGLGNIAPKLQTMMKQDCCLKFCRRDVFYIEINQTNVDDFVKQLKLFRPFEASAPKIKHLNVLKLKNASRKNSKFL